MAVITSGKIFTNGEQLTADKMNQMFTSATFDSTGAINSSNLQVLTDGSLSVKDSGITTAKIADTAVTTAKIADSAVTTEKIADSAITSAKLSLTDGATISKTGTSQTITSFNTTQGGSSRGLRIKTPADSDTNSPFVINTANSISFEIDDTEAIRIDAAGRLIISNIPTSASGLSSGTVYSDSGTLKIVS